MQVMVVVSAWVKKKDNWTSQFMKTTEIGLLEVVLQQDSPTGGLKYLGLYCLFENPRRILDVKWAGS